MKKNKSVLYQSAIAVLLAGGMLMLSCNKKFDEPPAYIPPDITANLSIRDLKAMHVKGNAEQITGDKVIEGVVVADDQSGNFYKSIVIEDSTAGILVKLDAYDLYTDYPIGRHIFIKMNGLYMGDYNGLIEIGGSVDNSGATPSVQPVAPLLISKYVLKGTLGNVVAPKIVTAAQLADSLQNELIQLDNFEFAATDTAATYADPALGSSAVNFTLKSCDGSSIILRNSSYADFAGYNLPNGNGSIIAVYAVFGSTKQLNIRDTSDVKFYDTRCGIGNIFNEDFATAVSGADLSLAGWINVPENGTVKYKGAAYGGNNFVKVSAFASSQSVVKSWLITPAIDVSTHPNPALTFDNADGYDNGAMLKIYISQNYDGINAAPWSSAVWTELSATISGGHTSGYGSFISSGNIDLSAYTGKIHIAFVYEGADPAGTATDKTTTFEIDNVKVNGD